jgi:hypothetical protein
MSGIFISYRRKDSIAWAGRLFDHLSKSFGREQVFMDVEGGIPRGADFEQVLTSALENCDALLALIGPEWWSCTRSDGRRRLEVPEDWVRREIATALKADKFVVPVLVGSGKLPEGDQLPEELRRLAGKHFAEISDTRWEYDVGELIKDLRRGTHLDVTSASTGIQLLKELIETIPAVADAVSRSQEVIENTYSQVLKLSLYKELHDALHNIEFECLRPLKAGGAIGALLPFKIRFAARARRIETLLLNSEIKRVLRDALQDQLQSVADAFQAAGTAPGAAEHGRVVGELDVLLSGFPAELDMGIVNAASELDLKRLVELMDKVSSKIPSTHAGKDVEIQSFVRHIDALKRVSDELASLVAEHAQLQRLDAELRSICVGRTAGAALGSDWARIKRTRARLTAPFSPELEAARQDLADMEAAVEAAIADASPQGIDLVGAYFEIVRSVFLGVDTRLKEMCGQLGKASEPLKTILEMCHEGA